MHIVLLLMSCHRSYQREDLIKAKVKCAWNFNQNDKKKKKNNKEMTGVLSAR